MAKDKEIRSLECVFVDAFLRSVQQSLCFFSESAKKVLSDITTFCLPSHDAILPIENHVKYYFFWYCHETNQP